MFSCAAALTLLLDPRMEYHCVFDESSSMVNRRLLAGTEEQQKQPVASETQRSLSRWAIELILKRCKRLLSGGTGDNRSFPWRPPLRLGRRRRGGILIRGKEETKKKSTNKKGAVGFHVGHQRLHLLRFLPSTRQRQVETVPAGHIAVSVGPEQTRFLVPVGFLNSPLFQSLLAQSKEAFGYHHHGALSLPCHVTDFQDALTRLSLSSTTGMASRGSATVQSKNRPF